MKNKIKKAIGIVLISMLSLLLTTPVHAQQGPPPLPNSSQIKSMVMKLSESIELNDTQSKQMFDLYTEHFQEVKEKMQAGRPSRKEMEQLQNEFKSDAKSILTDDQYEAFLEFMKQNNPAQKRPNRPNRDR